jgi:uncharacterized small protein (DUF1192 family)
MQEGSGLPSPETLEPGQRFGHYELLERRGQDPFSTVWRASNVVRKFAVDVRVIHSYLARREAAPGVVMLTTFMHPSLVEVLEVRTGVAMPHVVYRPCAGERLDEALVRGPLPWPRVAALASDLLAALGALHESGNCLGRLSPELVIVADDGHPRLDGAGVQPMVSDEYQAILSSQDPLACAEQYLTPRGDLWSLGTLVWCAATARMAPAGPLPALSAMLPDVPEALDAFIRVCRADGGETPFADADEARRALQMVLAETQVPRPEPEADTEPAPEAAAPPELPPAPPDAQSPPPVEPAAHAPLPGEAAPTLAGADGLSAETVAHLEDRLAGLQDEIARRAGRWAQGEAQAAALLETIGHAQLRLLESERGLATVRRHNARLALSSLVWPIVAVGLLGMGARGVFVSLESSPLSLATKCALAAAVFGATAVLGIWLVLRLGLLRVESRCEVVVTPDEVVCRRPGTPDITDRIAARTLRAVEVLRPAVAGQHGGSYRLRTRRGPGYTLTFDGAVEATEPR